jgi:hypothetical protein
MPIRQYKASHDERYFSSYDARMDRAMKLILSQYGK